MITNQERGTSTGELAEFILSTLSLKNLQMRRRCLFALLFCLLYFLNYVLSFLILALNFGYVSLLSTRVWADPM